AVYTWDASGNGTTFDGPGTWSTNSANWYTGSGDIPWTGSADVAVFGTGASGSLPTAVTLGSNVSANSLIFANQTYMIAGDAGGMYGLTVDSAVTQAIVPATISAPIILSAPQTWTTSSGLFTISGSVNTSGNLLTVNANTTTNI